MHFVFFQEMLGILHSALIRSLAAQGHQVTVIAECELTDHRRAMGWSVPDMGSASIICAAEDEVIWKTCATFDSDSVFIVHGFRGYRVGRLGLQYALQNARRVGFLLEGGDPHGVAGWLRRSLYTFEGLKLKQGVQFLLAMGQNGVRWYRQCGYPDSKVFPFGYFMEIPSNPPGATSRSQTKTVDMVFVGQCVPRKGLDLAIRALALLKGQSWTLTIIGDGPVKDDWQKLATKTGIADQVQFLPAMRNADALQIVTTKDCLLLPSRFDGWGAVVNEALMRGVPVICSDQCAAADLLREAWRGQIFRSESVSDLTRVLKNQIAQGKIEPVLSEHIKSWSQMIRGDMGASYLGEVVQHVYNGAPRPTPPWY